MSDQQTGDVAFETYGPRPPRVFAPVWLGWRFSRAHRQRLNGSMIATPSNKGFRRMMRRRLLGAGKSMSVWSHNGYPSGRRSGKNHGHFTGITGRVDATLATWRQELHDHLAGMSSHAKRREREVIEAWERDARAEIPFDRIRIERRKFMAGRRLQAKMRSKGSPASASSTP